MSSPLDTHSLNFRPHDVDLLWFRSAEIFHHLFAEAFLSSNAQISVENFKKVYATGLRRRALKVEDIDTNVLLINNEFCVWLTRELITDERIALRAYLFEKKIARVGYIIRLDNIPKWGRIQLSRRHFTTPAEQQETDI